jgi:hypothetical protein
MKSVPTLKINLSDGREVILTQIDIIVGASQ